jgi:hypothetical protein
VADTELPGVPIGAIAFMAHMFVECLSQSFTFSEGRGITRKIDDTLEITINNECHISRELSSCTVLDLYLHEVVLYLDEISGFGLERENEHQEMQQ